MQAGFQTEAKRESSSAPYKLPPEAVLKPGCVTDDSSTYSTTTTLSGFASLLRNSLKAWLSSFSLLPSDRTQGNVSELHWRSFRLATRRHFLPERVVKHWNRLPREVADISNLSMFKRHLDNALHNVLSLLASSDSWRDGYWRSLPNGMVCFSGGPVLRADTSLGCQSGLSLFLKRCKQQTLKGIRNA